jgi:WD40 repeat protein
VARLGQGWLELVRPSPDGAYVAVGGSIGVTVYRTGSFEQMWSAQTAWISELEWSPDSSMLAGGMKTGDILVWDAASGQVLTNLTVHSWYVTSLDWARTARLISAGADG